MKQRPIRMEDELWEAVKKSAKENGRSASGEIRFAIRQHLKNQDKARK